MWIKLIPLSKSCCLPSTECSFTADTEIFSEFQPQQNGWNFSYCTNVKQIAHCQLSQISALICLLSFKPPMKIGLCLQWQVGFGSLLLNNATGALFCTSPSPKRGHGMKLDSRSVWTLLHKEKKLAFVWVQPCTVNPPHFRGGAVSAEGQTPVIVR